MGPHTPFPHHRETSKSKTLSIPGGVRLGLGVSDLSFIIVYQAMLSERRALVRTVQKLVDEYKVVLHTLLADLAKVRLQHLHHLVEELKDECGVHIGPGSGHDPHVALVGVEVACAGNVGHWGAHGVTSMDDTHTKCVHSGSAVCVCVWGGGGGGGGRWREGAREGG